MQCNLFAFFIVRRTQMAKWVLLVRSCIQYGTRVFALMEIYVRPGGKAHWNRVYSLLVWFRLWFLCLQGFWLIMECEINLQRKAEQGDTEVKTGGGWGSEGVRNQVSKAKEGKEQVWLGKGAWPFRWGKKLE